VQAEMAKRSEQHHATPPPADGYAFTGLIRCGICGATYRHKIAGSAPKYKKSVWICSTFNSLGKTHCASQQIPDSILQAKLAEAGGAEGLQAILVPEPFSLSFLYADERRIDFTWSHPSRRDSWTPEMREAARQKSKDRRAQK